MPTASPLRINRFFRPVFLCLLIYLAYILVVLGTQHWDPMELVRVGGHFDAAVGGSEMGYDGQFAYQIARDPLDGWRYVDLPAYRYQRILFPLLSLVLSGGNEILLPWVMIVINLVSLVVSVLLLEMILDHFGQSHWPALGYGLFIGTLMSLRLCLNEPLAYALVLGGIWFALKGKLPVAAGLLGLAVLTKEVTVLFVVAIGLSLLRKPRNSVGFVFTSVLPFLLWKMVLFAWFHDWGISAGGAMATSFEWIPYAGWWKLAGVTITGFLTVSLLIVPLVILPSVLALIQSGRQILRRQMNESAWMLLLTAILVPFLPSSNILDPLGVSRALMGLVIAWIVYGAQNQSKRILKYCFLFALTGLFTWKDAFLPIGTYSQEG